MAKVIDFYVPTKLADTVEREIAAATRKGYRVWDSDKEIRLAATNSAVWLRPNTLRSINEHC